MDAVDPSVEAPDCEVSAVGDGYPHTTTPIV
jgi:hypothetical protein